MERVLSWVGRRASSPSACFTVSQLRPTVTPLWPELVLSLLPDRETEACGCPPCTLRARSSKVPSAGGCCHRQGLAFPWLSLALGLWVWGRGWPGGTVCPALRASAHSLPQPSLTPLGVTLAVSWAAAGCAVQEADPAVWAINSSFCARRAGSCISWYLGSGHCPLAAVPPSTVLLLVGAPKRKHVCTLGLVLQVCCVTFVLSLPSLCP